MQNSTQSAPRSWLVPFFWVLLVTAICQWSQAQGPNTREARFGKIQLQDALQSDEASGTDSAGTDFYEKHIKGKTVVINFFYAQCDQGVCDQVMSKLAKVQQLLGDRVGRDRFIVSITLAPTDDTPEALKTYARGIKAKPGWSFLRGNVVEIDNLRKRLGLGKVSPEFIRSLNEVSPEVEKAGKTIEAKSPTEWSPKSLRALVGDRVMWKIGGSPAGTHGLRITNWDVVKQFVEVEPVEEQWPFDATTGQSIGSTNTAGKVLVRLKIKSEPSVPTKITYNCTVQGKAMAGEVSLGQQHTGMLFAYSDRTNRHSFISFDATPTEIKETLADLEGNVAPVPAGGTTKALPEITIDAGPNVKWTSSGKSSTPAVPLKVSAKKGQTLLFRQVDTNPNRSHGIVFTTPDLVLLKTDTGTKPNAVLKQIDDFRLYNTDVAGAPNPQELARFEVTQDITTAPAFECTFHGSQMAGSVESVPAGGTTKALPEITIDAGPNVKWTSGGKSSTPDVPLKVSAKKGQTLLFRQVDTNPNRSHGIVFTTPDLVLLKTDTGTKPNAVLKQIDDFRLYNTDVAGATNPQELARFEVTQDITTAPAFECTFHGNGMAGSVEQAPAVGSAALPEITIDAGPNVKWTSGGKSSTPDVPLKVSAKKGQTLLFRQVDTNPNRSHGIVFTTPDLVLLKTDTGTKPNAVLKQIDDFRLYNTDVAGAPNPQELARFEVTQDITTAPAFECTFHGNGMAGSVEQAPAVGSAALPEITIDAGPNVKWTSGGKSSTPEVPLKVSAKKGQTLLFRQVDTNPNRSHGIVFTTPDLVLLKTDTGTKPNAVLKQIDDFRLYNTDVAGATNPQELARFEVTQDITTAPAFECTFHGNGMAGSVEQAPAVGSAALPEITIDAGPNVKWTSGGKSSTPDVPLKVSAKKGQTLLFRQVDTNPNRSHGIVFTTPDLVLLKTDTGTKPNAVLKQIDDFRLYNTDVAGATNPQELARFEVTQDITTAPAFECTFHGNGMAGSVEQAPAVGSAALPEITIDAGPNVKWTSGGKSSTPEVPLKVSAKKGQTLLFRQVDTNPNRSHGIVFTTPDLVLLKTDTGTKPNAVLKQIDDFRLYNTDVAGATNPQELARFEVTQDITTAPAFECTFHGSQMAGSVENAPAVGSAALPEIRIDAALIETPFRAMSASMQRRMLRFVNRAHVAEDLMKNPQEFRTRTEHAPAKLHEKKSDAKLGFPRAAAEALLASRPINGFREVRECLPAYQVSDTLDQLGPVVESLGENQFGKWELIRGGTPSVMHAALMNNGKVVFITNSLDTCVWDPTAAPVVLPPSATKLTDILYCSGHSFLSDGKLLAVGGGGSSPGVDTSIHAWKFNPDTQEWSRTAGNMSFQRWYPTAVTLGDEPGRVLVVAGDTGNGPAPQMEVYSETTDKFEKVTVTGRNLLFAPTYPGMHLLPAGEILHVPTGFDDCNQTPSARSADPTALFTFSSPNSGSWRILGRNQRLKGMSTLLFDTSGPFIQALVVGGGNLAKNKTAQTINLTAMTPAWSTPFPLLEERIHPNLVQLPDGTVFICGGKETNPITPPSGGRCELYNPKTGVIAEMDEMIVPRHYHSVALLLPDGRVMAAGGADDGGCTISTRNTIEVFSPPYLFKPGRPKIASATKFIEHGGTIEIKTPSAAGIGRVVLVRPMAVTHQTDSEQRVLQLSFQVTDADTIEAQAPGLATGANSLAPRGHYMLFILNQQGVPSVAKWIYLGATQVESLKANVQTDTSALKSDGDDLKLVDVNGTKRSLSEFDGRAHMLVLIRGAFCKHCTSQLAEFQKRIDPAKIPVIVITPENDLADLEDVPFTVLADTELSVFRKMNALGTEPLHGTFVFDADGTCLLKEIGEEPFTDYDAVEKALSKISIF